MRTQCQDLSIYVYVNKIWASFTQLLQQVNRLIFVNHIIFTQTKLRI